MVEICEKSCGRHYPETQELNEKFIAFDYALHERVASHIRGTGIAKQTAEEVSDVQNFSQEVEIAICMVPEVERQGYAIERAVSSEVWTLAKAINFTVIDIDREVHQAGRNGAFVRDGMHFSQSVATPVAR